MKTKRAGTECSRAHIFADACWRAMGWSFLDSSLGLDLAFAGDGMAACYEVRHDSLLDVDFGFIGLEQFSPSASAREKETEALSPRPI